MPWTGTIRTKAELRKALSAATKESRLRQRGRPVEIAGTGGWRAVGYWQDVRPFGTFPKVDLIDPWDARYSTGNANPALTVLESAMRGDHDYAPERAGGPRRWVIRQSHGDPRHPVGPFPTEAAARAHRDKELRGEGEVDQARPTDYPYAQGGKARRPRGLLAHLRRKLRAAIKRRAGTQGVHDERGVPALERLLREGRPGRLRAPVWSLTHGKMPYDALVLFASNADRTLLVWFPGDDEIVDLVDSWDVQEGEASLGRPHAPGGKARRPRRDVGALADAVRRAMR